jgi:hypothetical protein
LDFFSRPHPLMRLPTCAEKSYHLSERDVAFKSPLPNPVAKRTILDAKCDTIL